MAAKDLMKPKNAIGLAIFGWFLALFLSEAKRPLRLGVENKSTRVIRNVMIAGVSAILLQVIDSPLTDLLSRKVARKRLGLLNLVSLPQTFKLVGSVILLDYSLYLWHVLNHKLPVLWRFHVVHHVDLDLDASTAIRFHAGEMAISILWRLLQIRFLGISPLGLQLWRALLMGSILFHHSNIRLPIAIERTLNGFVVTPRMHGIHHSVVEGETNSNWSSGLTIWDKLHGTYRNDVPQDQIIIGVPAYQQKQDVGLRSMLSLPFVHQPPSWNFVLPEGNHETK